MWLTAVRLSSLRTRRSYGIAQRERPRVKRLADDHSFDAIGFELAKMPDILY